MASAKVEFQWKFVILNDYIRNIDQNYNHKDINITDNSYDEIFIVEKDKNDNITMIKSNMIVINEIISDIAIKIQEDMDKESRKNNIVL